LEICLLEGLVIDFRESHVLSLKPMVLKFEEPAVDNEKNHFLVSETINYKECNN